MPQPKVVKQFHFHAAHSVPKVEDCRQVHGHTYHLEVEIQGRPQTEGPEEGMVANARRIKSEVNEAVVDPLDHAFIAEGSERIVGPLRRHDYTVIEIGTKTTAENLSHWILQQLDEHTSLPVTRVRLWETDTMWAEAEIEEGAGG
jgi:6-pyruvoyltetrahydropterin/6-carboxytetrahydropterin synthase